jgi:hypothetical protein
MKHLPLLIILLLTLVLGASVHAQLTNLLVNGVSTNFTMVSGNTISWSYNIPPGSATTIEIWIDVNTNGIIDPLIDKTFNIFTQTDGDTNGNGGPPDMDGLVNGAVVFSQPVGLAPQTYIMKFTNNSSSVTIRGTITPLASPAYTISGHVTPPAGKSAEYIVVEANRSEQHQPNFWNGLTNVSGNYTIQMNSDTAGNPWHIRLSTSFPPNLPIPAETLIVIDGNKTGINFSFVAAAAQVKGSLTDENNNPIVDKDVYVHDTSSSSYSARTDLGGLFQIGIPLSALHGQTWTLESSTNGPLTTTELKAIVNLPVINPGDTLIRQLKIYTVNSEIRGTVRVDGSPASFMNLELQSDSGEAITMSDFSGKFTAGVSNKIYNYNIIVWNVPFGWSVQNVTAHPGDTTVVVNIFTQTNTVVSFSDGWNLLSVPLSVFDNQKTTLFPSAITPAYSYSSVSSYQTQTNLLNGVGYWMKFIGVGGQPLNGSPIVQETLAVVTGWNLFGALSSSIPIGTIITIPDSIIISPFYSYSSSYQSASSIDPGKGYWVKVNQNGSLILSTLASHQSSAINRRLFTDELPPSPPVNIDEIRSTHTPTTYALGQNYPNPFNPTTTIAYDIPATSFVTLSIFNTLGQEVLRAVNKEQPAGKYNTQIDASHLPSGIYYYRLTAGMFTMTNKMVIMK